MARASSLILLLLAEVAVAGPYARLDLLLADNDIGFTGSQIGERDEVMFLSAGLDGMLTDNVYGNVGVRAGESFGSEEYNPSGIYATVIWRP